MKTIPEEMCNVWHSVSIAFPQAQAQAQAMQLHEYRHHFKVSLLDKSKLAQHAFEEDHRIVWDEIGFLEIEVDSRYRKYLELAHHVTCVASLISQRDEVTNSKKSLCQQIHHRFLMFKSFIFQFHSAADPSSRHMSGLS
jgi:hypothetical protein